MKFVDGCPDCQRLSAQYEAAAIEWFRIQNQLDIAGYLRDSEASSGIVRDLAVLGKKRQGIRELVESHLAEAHNTKLIAGGAA
jgi:hypothetical protein